ncbi:hypothetical protein BJ878DRAFT_13217 [Calycina marina]|uniref:Uncharacterized protein n=1 Tax=Calycina marina TaxID=1763456 RepID=A0A9P8CAU2_9HELO|nr:hypothetical protein BJ878DRAFT_13217 [Calycina marina]
MSTPPDVAECKSALTSYREWTVRLLDAVSADKPRNWARSMVTEESSGHETIEEHIKEYEDGNNVIDAKLGLSAVQNAQVTKILEDIKLSEHDVRFEWCWAEISLYSDGGTYSQLATSADIMYLVAKRTLKPTYHPQDIYHALLRGQALPPRHPAGFPGPPGPPPGPPPGWRPLPPDLRVVHGKLKKSYSSIDSDTDFNTDSTSSIVGPLQQKVNRFKCRSPARRPVNYSSDSDSDAQDDALKFDLDLKKGDSIVQKLLDRWTVNEPAND